MCSVFMKQTQTNTLFNAASYERPPDGQKQRGFYFNVESKPGAPPSPGRKNEEEITKQTATRKQAKYK